ncbi:MAG: DUF5357 family protein [Leptolyngbyaceae cyanobacterium T60_A2020_046]|nr:DUF5357 family protein [Leptolyngbyaceae cyanobacterium T60_A2020_046]
MIQFLRSLLDRVYQFLFPQQYFAWQTMMYLGIFSLIMSWIARLSGATAVTEWLIATGSWTFFSIGVGWFLEHNQVRPFGIALAPWVSGALVCTYVFSLIPGSHLSVALITWPLISVAIVAVPQFLSWDFSLKQPAPPIRQQLVLLLLVALLISSWFQFYFRLQRWLGDYPTLLSEDFSRSGFVTRLSDYSDDQARGIALLTFAENQIKEQLNDMPWSWTERWLLNRPDQIARIQNNALALLSESQEQRMWQLTAPPPRGSDSGGYVLRVLAIWLGPAANPEGFYLEKSCQIRPRTQPSTQTSPDSPPAPPTVMTTVNCELGIPKKPGRPEA